MRVLVTGRGKSGSWLIRGEQLGAAIGAAVRVDPTDAELAAADVVVMVKRPRGDIVQRIRAAGKPLVWDVVDAWPQPVGNAWDLETALQWLRARIAEYHPAAVVAATRSMERDLGEFCALPCLTLQHHARPWLTPQPIRDRVRVVAYEGGVHYLGRWQQAVERACAARGWRFVLNPPSFDGVDLLVAFRDCTGYAAQNWKSNVKLATAQALGLPIVMQPEAGYVETGGGVWCGGAPEGDLLASVFEHLGPQAVRDAEARRLREAHMPLDALAAHYRAWLETL